MKDHIMVIFYTLLGWQIEGGKLFGAEAKLGMNWRWSVILNK